ncbi:30S ribosomal protein S16 [Streptomyces griseosporeus]|uniref:30S ribosomal protein S16 n=1 Tax=Streptomyces griseosporeus TaxID=1910 RepID=UPI0036A2242A
MAVKIKLKRLGKIRSPHYRIVVADSRTRRDGRAIEEIGKYQPTYNPSVMEVDSERVAYWLSVGAQPTEPVLAILKKTGDWQKFKGEPAPAPLLQPAEKPARPSFEALGGDDEAKGEAITPKKKAEKKDEAAAESSASESTEA